MGPIFPGEGDLCVRHRHDAPVADGGAADVGAQIFDDVLPVAEGLQMHAPVHAPYSGIEDGQLLAEVGIQALESGPEGFGKAATQDALGHEEAGALDRDHPAFGVQARAGNDGVQVRMKEQPLVPGVQDQGAAGGLGPEPTATRQGKVKVTMK